MVEDTPGVPGAPEVGSGRPVGERSLLAAAAACCSAANGLEAAEWK